MADTFKEWKTRYNSYFKDEYCHFNLNQEFISLYSMEVNKALSALLRLTEIDDLVRQLAHLSRVTLVGFPDLPRFLAADLALRFSRIPSLSSTVAALQRGFSLMIEPIVDFQLANSRSMQIHLVFTFPELANTTAICTLEQLVPLSYQIDTHCFGGAITRTDLLLLSCAYKRYVITQTELKQCFKADSTILCPENVLSAVEDPVWLGLKWFPNSQFSFNHAHARLSACPPVQPLIHLDGRYYLSTAKTNLTLTSDNNGSHLMTIHPLGIYHFPCHYSFPFQRTGFGSCVSKITLHFPLFTNSRFQFMPWSTRFLQNNSMFSTPAFHIPSPLSLDKSTLKSLDATYNVFDADLTRRLQAVTEGINNLHLESSHTQEHTILLYFAVVLTVFNFIALVILCCVFHRQRSTLASQSLLLHSTIRTADATTGTAI